MAKTIRKEMLLVALIGSVIQLQVISSSAILNDLGKPLKYRTIGPASFECIADGDFAHETRCEAFYRCKDGAATLMACFVQYDLLFNEKSAICNYAYNTHCGDRERPPGVPGTEEPPPTTVVTTAPTTVTTTKEPTTTTKATTVTETPSTSIPTTIPPEDCYNCTENGAFPHPKYCEKYFDCWNGTSVLLKCPKNPEGQQQLFDLEYRGCKVAVLTDCGDRIRPTPEFQCPNNTDLYYTDPYNCAGFYRCVDGISTHYTCPPPLLFNPDIDVCDFSVNVDCSDRRHLSYW